MESFLQKVTYKTVIDHLLSAEQYWYAAVPGVFEEISQAILEAVRVKPDLIIELVIDPNESAFRSHFGDVDAINELRVNGISIKEMRDHRLGFIISDQSAWLLFAQSRAIEKDPAGYNAIRMSALTKNELLLHFFGHIGNRDIRDEYTEEMRELIEVQKQINGEGKTAFTPSLLDEDKFEYVNHSLEHNPPPSPDFKRLYDVYSTKIKFIEFEVSGIKFHQKTISIPNDILNLVDENLRSQISTRLNLFDESSQEQIKQKLSTIEREVENIREELLKRVTSRNKSVIRSSNLLEFNKRIEALIDAYSKIQDEVESDIRSGLISVKERLTNELYQNFKHSPPDNLKRFKNNDQFELFVKDYAKDLVGNLHLPSPESLMNSFKVTKRIFDPTHNDFRDEDFISELEEVGFIKKAEKEEIVQEFKAIGIQPNEL